MSTPYQPPAQGIQKRDYRADVSGPAIALIIVSLIAIALGCIGLVIDVVLLMSGAVEDLEEINTGPIPEFTQIVFRFTWGVILVIASSCVLYGAIQMKNLKNYGVAKAAAIVAMIPMIGPCCLLGIPFGIWAFIVLGKPGVRNAFT